MMMLKKLEKISLENGKVNRVMIRKKTIKIIDTLTAIILFMQLESLLQFIVVHFRNLGDLVMGYGTPLVFLFHYKYAGLIFMIYTSPLYQVFIAFFFIVFCMNFVVVILKIIDFFFGKEKILRGKYRYLIIMNLVFLAWWIVDYYYMYQIIANG